MKNLFIVHIKGNYALFTRPEFKTERVSYETITPSAARNILDAVYWKPGLRWVIRKIYILSKPDFVEIRKCELTRKIHVNDFRKDIADGVVRTFADDERTLRSSLLLYRFECAVVASLAKRDRQMTNEQFYRHLSNAHRRLRLGQCYRHPYLGCSEYPATLTLLKSESQIPASPYEGKTFDLGIMLYDIDYDTFQPIFYHAVAHNGVIDVLSAPKCFQNRDDQ